MMILAEEMSEAGFFDWICLWLAQKVRFKPTLILVAFMVFSALLSMFVDSITVILFMVVATVQMGRLLQFDPAPVIIAEIFSANLGGAATMSGDPPNIILGTSLGLGFWDFIRNNGVICLAAFCLMVVYFVLAFRTKLGKGVGEADPFLGMLDPADAIPDRDRFRTCTAIFGLVILLVMAHIPIGLTMPSIGLMAGAMALAATKYPMEILKKVHWKTFGFIIGMMVVVSGLEQTHVLDGLAQFLAGLAGGDHTMMVVVLIWFTAICSAFVDNIPMTTVMVPVILSLSDLLGMDLSTLAWTMSKGTDIGGIATPIGASANVVGLSVSEAKNRLKNKGFAYKVVGDGDEVTDQTPAGSAVIPGKSTVILYAGEEKPDSKCTVPALVGKTPAEANVAATNAGILLRFTGTTASASGSIRVLSQSVEVGTKVEAGTVISVQLGDTAVID